MEVLINKAKILMEAMPYIQKFRAKTFVIKYGGSAMVDPQLREGFARDVVMLKLIGVNPIIVHGGGPQIAKVLAQMGMESKFHNGIRITDDATMDVVEMVLAGQVNKNIVRLINSYGGKALGYSGIDASMITAKKLDPEKVTFDKSEGVSEIIDLGRVGHVKSIDTSLLKLTESSSVIPVIAPLGVSEEGEVLNINADIVASSMASHLRSEKLMLMTDVEGVLDQDKSLVRRIDIAKAREMLDSAKITGGMIPKLKWALKASENGVKQVHIVDGRLEHSLLLEVFTDQGVGTLISA